MDRGALPPSPSLRERIRIARAFSGGDIDAFTSLREKYGDVVWLGAPIGAYVVFHPEAAERILVSNHRNYKKSNNYKEMKLVMGNGLVTSDGELWQQQRRRVAGTFKRDSLRHYAQIINDLTEESLIAWEAHSSVEEPLDLTEAIGHLTCRIAGQVFLGVEVEGVATEVQRCSTLAADAFLKRVYAPIKIPRPVPTPANRREKKAVQTLDRIIYKLMDDFRRDPPATPSVLGALLQEVQGGNPMSARQIRDEVCTLFLAGQETISAGIQWFLHLLASKPGFQERIATEVVALGESPPSLSNLRHLPELGAAFKEALRLYPPIPVLGRTPLADDVLSGYDIPKGSVVLCPIYALHRDERFWPDPTVFSPNRFLNKEAPTPGTYLPFAAGPRKCIGDDLAMIEGLLIGAAVLQRFELVPESKSFPTPHTTITLNPEGGPRMLLLPRRKSTREDIPPISLT